MRFASDTTKDILNGINKNMTDEMNVAGRQVARRTVVKGAAWSVPAIAAAVAMPLAAAATNVTTFDVRVQREKCTLVGASITNAQKPNFTIYADAGVIPAGSVFNLTVATGLLNLALFQDDPNAGYDILDLGLIGGGKTYQITTTRAIDASTPLRVDYLPDAFIAAFAGSNASLTYVSSPSGTEAGPGKNADTMSVSGLNILGIRVYSCSA